jgi:hypothetical protein
MNHRSEPSLWNLPANPLFRRYAAARLRIVRLIVWVILSQVITGFLWALAVLIYLISMNPAQISFELGTPAFDSLLEEHGQIAFLIGWMMVLIVQGVIVIMKGTFSVATGAARESNEGMMDGIHLTPLSTSRKIVGQLLGLPILENLIAIQLLPWVGLSAVLGGLPLEMIGKVYLLFASSALFHHAIGLVAGTIIRQKILAGTLAQLCVILLHFVLPTFGKFGIGVISHLGVEPAIYHTIVRAVPSVTKPEFFQSNEELSSTVSFFRWEFLIPGYHWVITISALAILVVILARRWNDRRSLLLGKVGVAVSVCWILTLTCGELLPKFEGGNIPVEFAGRVPGEVGQMWVLGFGMMLGILNLVFVSLLVPSREARIRVENERWWGDGRDALPWVLGISLMSIVAWCLLIRAMNSGDFGSMPLEFTDVFVLSCSIMIPAVSWYAFVLWQGWKRALCIGFIVGVLPLMISILGALVSASPDGWPKWFGGASLLVMPGYAAAWRMPSMTNLHFGSVFLTSALCYTVATVFISRSARLLAQPRRFLTPFAECPPLEDGVPDRMHTNTNEHTKK